ncbi:MAG TPA: hypothetical protein VEV37_07185 [Bryobacteraceae bacterium]|nr:hypothetical protein [Bryobacteraceae bacterium]
MSKQFLIFFGIGVVVVAIAVTAILQKTKGNHLVLNGKILKIRNGALGDSDSIAVLDFRVENPTDVPFVVREVDVTLEQPNGNMLDGQNVTKGDLKQLFQYNRFLGEQYNDGLAIKDRIAPHTTVDRMVAVRFELKNHDLETAKAIHMTITDMDGPTFETSRSMQ